MSFISVLKKIATVGVSVGRLAIPLGSMLYPPAAPWLIKIDDAVQHLFASVIATEENNIKDGQGAVKAESVNGDINSYIDTMNAGLAFVNKKVVDDPVLRKGAIDAAVASFNAAAKWKASFKPVDI